MTYLIDDMLEGALHSLLGTSQCLENQHRHSELSLKAFWFPLEKEDTWPQKR